MLEATGTAPVREALSQALDAAGLRSSASLKDSAAVVRAAQRWIQSNIRYLREYPETYQTPARTLEWRVGDCDDQAPLLAAMVRSARIPARLVVVGWDGDDEPRPVPRHIYAQAQLPQGWTSAETVKPVALGWDAGKWKESQGRRVAYSLVGDTGPLG